MATSRARAVAESFPWRGILLGQCISLLVSGTAVFSEALQTRACVTLPTTQSFFNYVLLSLYLVPWYRKGGGWRAPSVPRWTYALVAVADVEANFLVVTAYRYTSMTSVTLLDCFNIPFVMALSSAFLASRGGGLARCCVLGAALRARYTKRHVLGVAVCLAGLAVLVATDAFFPKAKSGDGGGDGDGDGDGGGASCPPAFAQRMGGPGSAVYDPALGDLLCVGGALLYAVSNVAQESLVKRFDASEFLGFLGAFGTLISGVQVAVLERDELARVGGSGAATAGQVAGYIAGFVACLFCMYSLTALFLRESDAAFFNLSLLTSDIWAALASAFVFGRPPHWPYWCAFVVIVAGLVVYNREPRPTNALMLEGGHGGGGGGGGGGDADGYGDVGPDEAVARLELFYLRHNPSKVGGAAALVAKYAGNAGRMFRALEEKYGAPMPTLEEAEAAARDREEKDDDEGAAAGGGGGSGEHGGGEAEQQTPPLKAASEQTTSAACVVS